MTKKSDLLDIDLNEELTAIRAQKAGKNVLRKKKLKVPSDVAKIRHRLGLTLGARYARTTRTSNGIVAHCRKKPEGSFLMIRERLIHEPTLWSKRLKRFANS